MIALTMPTASASGPMLTPTMISRASPQTAIDATSTTSCSSRFHCTVFGGGGAAAQALAAVSYSGGAAPGIRVCTFVAGGYGTPETGPPIDGPEAGGPE